MHFLKASSILLAVQSWSNIQISSSFNIFEFRNSFDSHSSQVNLYVSASAVLKLQCIRLNTLQLEGGRLDESKRNLTMFYPLVLQLLYSN